MQHSAYLNYPDKLKKNENLKFMFLKLGGDMTKRSRTKVVKNFIRIIKLQFSSQNSESKIKIRTSKRVHFGLFLVNLKKKNFQQ